MMDIRPIKSERDYERALGQIEQLMDAKPGSKAGDEEAVRFRMDQLGMTRKDLEAVIGGRGRVSEVLSKKRRLTLPMIRRLHRALRIPLESLVGTAA